jgi:hypothetical protein
MNIEGQQEPKKAVAVKAVESKSDVAEKLERGFRYVTIPDVDLYNYKFEGISVNQDNYKPGKHLVSADIADTLEDRLKVWSDYNTRLMRPQADITALQQLGQIAKSA